METNQPPQQPTIGPQSPLPHPDIPPQSQAQADMVAQGEDYEDAPVVEAPESQNADVAAQNSAQALSDNLQSASQNEPVGAPMEAPLADQGPALAEGGDQPAQEPVQASQESVDPVQSALQAAPEVEMAAEAKPEEPVETQQMVVDEVAGEEPAAQAPSAQPASQNGASDVPVPTAPAPAEEQKSQQDVTMTPAAEVVPAEIVQQAEPAPQQAAQEPVQAPVATQNQQDEVAQAPAGGDAATGAALPIQNQPAVQASAPNANVSEMGAAGMGQSAFASTLGRSIFDKIKKGDIEDVVRTVRESNIDMRNLVDEPKNFSQTPIFSASVIHDHEQSFKMIQVLVEMGVDPKQEDMLKQTPIFYAAREGNNKAIQFLLQAGDDVNRQDKYGQTPIYYAVREGHIKTSQVLIDHGAKYDMADNNSQRAIYYAIKHDKFEMVKFLIEKGADLQTSDKKGMTPTHWARRQGKPQILDLLLQNGGQQVGDPRRPSMQRKPSKVAPAETKPRVNEKKIPRRYVLTTLRESGYYEPMTDEEFAGFKAENPQIAKYFELNDEGEDLAPISGLEVPEVSEGAPIYDQWEKAASRLMTNLQRNPRAYIFAEPVDYEALKIPDYPTIVKNPMDFGSIKTKLKEHQYGRIQEFMDDMELVFYNCKLYNGIESEVGQICISIQEEYHTICEQLYFDFYKQDRVN